MKKSDKKFTEATTAETTTTVTETAIVDPNQQKFPEFLKDSPAVEHVEILDPAKLACQLTKATEYIRKEVGGVAKSFCRIGFKLWEVRENKLYLGEGFKNVYEYGERVLGFKKSSTAKYISVCERFSVHKNDKPTAQLMPGFANFSYTQLSEMLSLPDSKLEEVTPELTCKEIRDMKNADQQEDCAEAAENSNYGYAPGVRVAPPIQIFSRVLTKENLALVLKLLHENIGREIQILVEDNSPIPASEATA